MHTEQHFACNDTLTGRQCTWVDPRIRRLQDLIERNPNRDLRLSYLARASRLSASRLSHLFKNCTGVAPGHYIRRVRLQMARELVESTTLSVKETSAQVGYESVSHFIREFRKSFGLTPAEHRRRRGGPSNEKKSSASDAGIASAAFVA
jgi:AraC family transcriptional regulator of arabinose operon